MKRRTKTLLAAAIAAIPAVLTIIPTSCSQKEDDPPQPEITVTDTPEEILTGVASVYTVDTVMTLSNYYLFKFADPTPVSLKKDYPEGIKEVYVDKADVADITDDGQDVAVTFKDGKTAVLSYDSWIKVEFDRSIISFNEQKTPDTLHFSVTCSSPDITVATRGCEKYVTSDVTLTDDLQDCIVTFTPTTDEYFAKDMTLTISNGRRSRSHTVSIVRENFKFDDGSVSQTYSFPEYARFFKVRLDKADNTAEAAVSEDASHWLRTKVFQNHYGEHITIFEIMMEENTGDQDRTGRITVTKPGTKHELTIEITQLGTETEGSLRHALTAFYNGTNGTEWNCNDNWCSDRPLWEWYGVSSDNIKNNDFGEYTYCGTDDIWTLSLTANHIRGEIPAVFWKCTSLANITISREYLPTSTVPDCIWRKGLTRLDLSTTFMNTPLTSSVSKATDLLYLDLGYCNVAGDIPQEITALTQLEYLNLAFSFLTGQMPQNIGNMKSLKQLNLSVNPELCGSLPESFYELENLILFYIGGTGISGTLSERISNLKHLRQISINDCEFEGTIPEVIGELPLISWDFDYNYFDALPELIRYRAWNSRNGLGTFLTSNSGDWMQCGSPVGVPYVMKRKGVELPDYELKGIKLYYEDIIVDGHPLEIKRWERNINNMVRCFPFPIWARIRYGFMEWFRTDIREIKNPQFPYADDLQYPATEYYFDGKDWRHPKLEYPAREYYKEGDTWLHDASCPWDKQYEYEGEKKPWPGDEWCVW